MLSHPDHLSEAFSSLRPSGTSRVRANAAASSLLSDGEDLAASAATVGSAGEVFVTSDDWFGSASGENNGDDDENRADARDADGAGGGCGVLNED